MPIYLSVSSATNELIVEHGTSKAWNWWKNMIEKSK